jgi:hypothetical protein
MHKTLHLLKSLILGFALAVTGLTAQAQFTDRMDGAIASLAIKAPCRVATTANITLSGLQTINGVTVVAGDRVLVKDQTTTTHNGIYVAATGAWERAKDFDGNRDAVQGTIVLVRPAGDSTLFYELTSANPIVIGTSAITFTAADTGIGQLASAAADGGSALVAFDIDQAGTAGTVAARLGEDISVTDYGASAASSNAVNKAALQAAITAIDAAGGGTVRVPRRINYGYIVTDRTTWPSFAGTTNDIVVVDYGPGFSYSSPARDGMQVRYFSNTPQTTPVGQHDGNGHALKSNWAPYYWVDNTADYTGARAATDNRRASFYTAVNGRAVWMMGQGTLESNTATDAQMSNWHLRLFGTTFGLPFNDIDAVIVDATTGGWWFNTDSNTSDAAYHFKQRTLGYYAGVFEGLTTTPDLVIRNSAGTGQDVAIRNSAGDLALRVVGIGDALTVTRANRRVSTAAAFVPKANAVTYSASMSIDADTGNVFLIVPNNSTAFTINSPTNGAEGQTLSIRIKNTTGGALGAATFGALFRMTSWAQPATGFSRTIHFMKEGANWVESGRTAADVQN